MGVTWPHRNILKKNVFYKLPYDIEWPGTFILAEIPITNQTVDLY